MKIDLSHMNKYISHIEEKISILDEPELEFVKKNLQSLKNAEDNQEKYDSLYYLQKHLHYQRGIQIGDYAAWLRVFN